MVVRRAGPSVAALALFLAGGCSLLFTAAGSDAGPDDCGCPPGQQCDEAGDCVDCRVDLHCSGDAPLCRGGVCVGCMTGPVGDADCAARDEDRPFCLEAAGCVECLDTEACTGGTVCDQDGFRCRGCLDHFECPSLVCDLDARACVDASDVIYVSPDGTLACSGGTAPCRLINSALNLVQGSRTFIHLAPGTYPERVSVPDFKVALVASGGGAVLRPGGGSPHIVLVGAEADVSLDGVEIAGAVTEPGTVGVRCEQGGVLRLFRSAVRGARSVGVDASGCDVTIERSRLTDNAGGGLRLDGGTFVIVNNVIARNGGASTDFGGISISNVSGGDPHRVEFNTLTRNNAQENIQGVRCASVTKLVALSSNIIYANPSAGVGLQISDTAQCVHTFSNIEGIGSGGQGNIDLDPMFVDLIDYPIATSSPVAGQANQATDVAVDIKGVTRPQGGRFDIGAHEAAASDDL
jgi:hypothetical protein